MPRRAGGTPRNEHMLGCEIRARSRLARVGPFLASNSCKANTHGQSERPYSVTAILHITLQMPFSEVNLKVP